MRINIIYKDDKIIIETTKKYISIEELFDTLRQKYAIDDDKRLLLISETIIYKENELINHKNMLESNLPKSKEDFVLICLDDYKNDSFKHNDRDSNDPKYSKENMIMKVTGASIPIKQDKKVKQRGRLLRQNFFNNFEMSNLIGYHRYDILSNVEEDVRSNYDDVEHDGTGTVPRYNIPTLLGRIRERDSNRPNELSFYATSSSVREEDINRLVNEMGFPDNSVRIALRMTRNNLNRAVDLLLNNPEELTEDNLQITRPPQALLQRIQAATQTTNNNGPLGTSIESNIISTNINRNTNISRNFDERNLAESTFGLQIPVIPSNNIDDQQNFNISGWNHQQTLNNLEILNENIGPNLNEFEELLNNNESSNFINNENFIFERNNNNNANDNPEIVFSPIDEYIQEDDEDESSSDDNLNLNQDEDESIDDNFILNQNEDEEMEYGHSIQSDEISDEFV